MLDYPALPELKANPFLYFYVFFADLLLRKRVCHQIKVNSNNLFRQGYNNLWGDWRTPCHFASRKKKLNVQAKKNIYE